MKRLFLLIIVLFSHSVNSQITNASFLSFNAQKGYIMAHRQSLRYLQKGHPVSFKISFGKKLLGSKYWHQQYRYPEIGLSYYFADLKYPEVLGNAHAVFSYINIPVISSKRFELSYKFGFGLSWLTKKFDTKDNYYNLAISSHQNVYLEFGAIVSYEIMKNSYASVGLNITHFSNGSIAKPNLGINLVSVSTGIKHFLKPNKKKITHTHLPCINSLFFIIYSAGYKTIYPPDNRKYFCSSLSLEYAFAINHKKALGLGTDIFYNSSISKELSQSNSKEYSPGYDYQGGLHISYLIFFDRINFTIQQGFYLFGDTTIYGEFYNRFGLRYHFFHNYIASLCLKTHFGRADFIEWGVGYKF